MQIRYFQAAWGDIKNSPGWFGKICLLALLNFIPIFGQIVTLGYVYGWAREIAWGMHEPLPKSIFENGDGKFWRRGWFAVVTIFVFGLAPDIVTYFGTALQNAGLQASFGTSHGLSQGGVALGGIGAIIRLVGLAGGYFLLILSWIGCMRVAVYDRLSAGFQIGKIWKMFRRDTGGVMRIFGMYLLVGIIIVTVVTMVFAIALVFLFIGAASAIPAIDASSMDDYAFVYALIARMGPWGFAAFLLMLVFVFACLMAQVFSNMLVARAMGYWTSQFDVSHWRGQDDPMPFEKAATTPNAAAPMAPQQWSASSGNQPQSTQQPGRPSQQPNAPQFVVEQPGQQSIAQQQPGLQGAQQPVVQQQPDLPNMQQQAIAQQQPGLPSAQQPNAQQPATQQFSQQQPGQWVQSGQLAQQSSAEQPALQQPGGQQLNAHQPVMQQQTGAQQPIAQQQSDLRSAQQPDAQQPFMQQPGSQNAQQPAAQQSDSQGVQHLTEGRGQLASGEISHREGDGQGSDDSTL